MREMTTEEALGVPQHRHPHRQGGLGRLRRRPHVAPIWFVVEDGDILFVTSAEAGKSRALRARPPHLAGRRRRRAPYAFAKVDGTVEITEDPDELLRVATLVGGRYMGADQAEAYGPATACPASAWCGCGPRASPASKPSRTGTEP